MITSFNCECGNDNPSKAKEYDGCLGYEALICTVCGRFYDFDLEGNPRTNPADEWSKRFIRPQQTQIIGNVKLSLISIKTDKEFENLINKPLHENT
jgi:hypothetical protein